MRQGQDETVTDLTKGVYRRLYSGFTKGQRINKLSLSAEAWFWRVLATVDDFGNGDADPELCRAATVGRRQRVTTKQVSDWLREMREVGLVEFYSVKDEPYLHVAGFEVTQPAGKNGRRIRRYPSPDESEGIQGKPDVVSASDSDSDSDSDSEDDNDIRAATPLAEVFSYWQNTLCHPKAVLSPERKARIQARLKDSTVDEIKRAVDGCKASDFHMGRSERSSKVFDDIELICRTRSKLEGFIAIVENGNGKTSNPNTQNTGRDSGSGSKYDPWNNEHSKHI